MTPLEQAVCAARQAPSVFNTQPWAWRIDGDRMELFTDHRRRVRSIDPDSRLLLLSCGAALHHARTFLDAAGWSAAVERLPDGERPQLLARISLGPPTTPDPEAVRMAAVIARRHTDRRAFSDRPVAGFELTKLRRFVEAEGAYLHVVGPEQVNRLAFSAEVAAGIETRDISYRSDLRTWTSRPADSGDGVTARTAVRPAPRPVPVRDFFPGGEARLQSGPDLDRGAAFVVLFGLDDRPMSLLCAGEALSALLLLATADGLATAPLSDVVEKDWPRQLLRHLLRGIGEPYLVVRLGYRAGRAPAPEAPRRDLREFVTFAGGEDDAPRP
ncbi:MAG: nitroreductase [Actinomycetota bacterium]|nr:nitroreductase [Actinomycetota bacterium]